ncbi:unnamed protein product [Caenorhabditis auriculariae]|uniref:Deoxyuridine 5'-triphosphate nucleotidohydrolase n=1 Tax=Caenorhabditis auriculariae TaxID=2777116 RepID=A0A8S1HB80_9PELO|nr:unnamed protein product [Caenorhabditis auriculariae]
MDKEIEIKYVKVDKNAKVPKYGTAEAAGADLSSNEDCVIPAKGKRRVATGIRVEIPKGYYGRIAPRSGLALKNFIDVGAGVLDSDYRGEISVLLYNFDDKDFEIKVGDRICQMVMEKFAQSKFVEVEELSETERGDCGYGTSVGVTSPLEPEKAVGRGDEGREHGEDGGGRHLTMDSRGEKGAFYRIHRKMSSSTVLTVFAALVASANGLLWLQWGGDANARAYE